jgi:hypothetical protein
MRPSIQLASGKFFDFSQYTAADIKITDIAHHLSNLCRFTGACREFYSVAQHSVLVSLIVPAEHALVGLLHDATGHALMLVFDCGDGFLAVLIAGHNVIKFDVPAIQKVYPWFKPVQLRVDTMVLARLMYPDLTEVDTRLKAKGKLPPRLYKKHTLEAWGYRLGNYKGDFTGRGTRGHRTMERLLRQDVEVTSALLAPPDQVEAVPARLRRPRDGRRVDSRAAGAPRLPLRPAGRGRALQASWRSAASNSRRTREGFKPFYMAGAYRVPKKSVRTQVEELGRDPKAPIYEGKGKARVITGYKFRTMDTEEGAAYTPVKLTTFNPASRDHVANRLTKLYGWEPDRVHRRRQAEGGRDGAEGPAVSRGEALEEFFTVLKRIGQLAEGKEAWLKHVGGRAHPRRRREHERRGDGAHDALAPQHGAGAGDALAVRPRVPRAVHRAARQGARGRRR